MRKQKKNDKPTTPTNKPAPKNPQVLTNLWKGETGETGSRSHYLVAQNSKKTPALTTSSASWRKCQDFFNGLYTLRPANPAIHHSCLPSSSNENAKPYVPIWWGPQASSIYVWSGTIQALQLPMNRCQTEQCNPLQVSRPKDEVTKYIATTGWKHDPDVASRHQ